jgi:hypothetical protein
MRHQELIEFGTQIAAGFVASDLGLLGGAFALWLAVNLCLPWLCKQMDRD